MPSLAMERIKIRAGNARDRMEIMQKHYHDYMESKDRQPAAFEVRCARGSKVLARFSTLWSGR